MFRVFHRHRKYLFCVTIFVLAILIFRRTKVSRTALLLQLQMDAEANHENTFLSCIREGKFPQIGVQISDQQNNVTKPTEQKQPDIKHEDFTTKQTSKALMNENENVTQVTKTLKTKQKTATLAAHTMQNKKKGGARAQKARRTQKVTHEKKDVKQTRKETKENPPELDFSKLDLLALEGNTPETITSRETITKQEKDLQGRWEVAMSQQDQSPGSIFQPIVDSRFWVYSAFYDVPANGNATVRGIGIVDRNLSVSHNHTVYCHLFQHGQSKIVVPGSIDGIPDSHGLQFLATFLLCPLPGKIFPESVSFSMDKGQKQFTNELTVQYPGPKILRNFTICHAVLYGPFDWPRNLMHNWELHRALGAQHFYVYVQNVTTEVEQVIRAYEKAGLLTVLPWATYPAKLAHYKSQLVAINDCLYRNKHVSKYVLIHDSDEIIIPRLHKNWHELIRSFDGKKGRGRAEIGSFVIQTSQFCTPAKDNDQQQKSVKEALAKFNVSDEERDFLVRYDVQPFTHLSRSFIFQFPHKTKNIIKPEKVITMGIHFVWSFEPGYSRIVLHPDTAMLFHQKWCQGSSSTWLVDADILKFHGVCYSKLQKLYRQITKS